MRKTSRTTAPAPRVGGAGRDISPGPRVEKPKRVVVSGRQQQQQQQQFQQQREPLLRPNASTDEGSYYSGDYDNNGNLIYGGLGAAGGVGGGGYDGNGVEDDGDFLSQQRRSRFLPHPRTQAALERLLDTLRTHVSSSGSGGSGSHGSGSISAPLLSQQQQLQQQLLLMSTGAGGGSGSVSALGTSSTISPLQQLQQRLGAATNGQPIRKQAWTTNTPATTTTTTTAPTSKQLGGVGASRQQLVEDRLRDEKMLRLQQDLEARRRLRQELQDQQLEEHETQALERHFGVSKQQLLAQVEEETAMFIAAAMRGEVVGESQSTTPPVPQGSSKKPRRQGMPVEELPPRSTSAPLTKSGKKKQSAVARVIGKNNGYDDLDDDDYDDVPPQQQQQQQRQSPSPPRQQKLKSSGSGVAYRTGSRSSSSNSGPTVRQQLQLPVNMPQQQQQQQLLQQQQQQQQQQPRRPSGVASMEEIDAVIAAAIQRDYTGGRGGGGKDPLQGRSSNQFGPSVAGGAGGQIDSSQLRPLSVQNLFPNQQQQQQQQPPRTLTPLDKAPTPRQDNGNEEMLTPGVYPVKHSSNQLEPLPAPIPRVPDSVMDGSNNAYYSPLGGGGAAVARFNNSPKSSTSSPPAAASSSAAAAAGLTTFNMPLSPGYSSSKGGIGSNSRSESPAGAGSTSRTRPSSASLYAGAPPPIGFVIPPSPANSNTLAGANNNNNNFNSANSRSSGTIFAAASLGSPTNYATRGSVDTGFASSAAAPPSEFSAAAERMKLRLTVEMITRQICDTALSRAFPNEFGYLAKGWKHYQEDDEDFEVVVGKAARQLQGNFRAAITRKWTDLLRAFGGLAELTMSRALNLDQPREVLTIFVDHGVDMEILPQLTSADLRQMGLSPRNIRRLLAVLASSRPAGQAPLGLKRSLELHKKVYPDGRRCLSPLLPVEVLTEVGLVIAAVQMQTVGRGYLGRSRARHVALERDVSAKEEMMRRREEDAAIKIQRIERGIIARKQVRQIREEKFREERAAVAIQKIGRGGAARKRVKDLRFQKEQEEALRALNALALAVQCAVRRKIARRVYREVRVIREEEWRQQAIQAAIDEARRQVLWNLEEQDHSEVQKKARALINRLQYIAGGIEHIEETPSYMAGAPHMEEVAALEQEQQQESHDLSADAHNNSGSISRIVPALQPRGFKSAGDILNALEEEEKTRAYREAMEKAQQHAVVAAEVTERELRESKKYRPRVLGSEMPVAADIVMDVTAAAAEIAVAGWATFMGCFNQTKQVQESLHQPPDLANVDVAIRWLRRELAAYSGNAVGRACREICSISTASQRAAIAASRASDDAAHALAVLSEADNVSLEEIGCAAKIAFQAAEAATAAANVAMRAAACMSAISQLAETEEDLAVAAEEELEFLNGSTASSAFPSSSFYHDGNHSFFRSNYSSGNNSIYDNSTIQEQRPVLNPRETLHRMNSILARYSLSNNNNNNNNNNALALQRQWPGGDSSSPSGTFMDDPAHNRQILSMEGGGDYYPSPASRIFDAVPSHRLAAIMESALQNRDKAVRENRVAGSRRKNNRAAGVLPPASLRAPESLQADLEALSSRDVALKVMSETVVEAKRRFDVEHTDIADLVIEIVLCKVDSHIELSEAWRLAWTQPPPAVMRDINNAANNNVKAQPVMPPLPSIAISMIAEEQGSRNNSMETGHYWRRQDLVGAMPEYREEALKSYISVSQHRPRDADERLISSYGVALVQNRFQTSEQRNNSNSDARDEKGNNNNNNNNRPQSPDESGDNNNNNRMFDRHRPVTPPRVPAGVVAIRGSAAAAASAPPFLPAVGGGSQTAPEWHKRHPEHAPLISATSVTNRFQHYRGRYSILISCDVVWGDNELVGGVGSLFNSNNNRPGTRSLQTRDGRSTLGSTGDGKNSTGRALLAAAAAANSRGNARSMSPPTSRPVSSAASALSPSRPMSPGVAAALSALVGGSGSRPGTAYGANGRLIDKPMIYATIHGSEDDSNEILVGIWSDGTPGQRTCLLDLEQPLGQLQRVSLRLSNAVGLGVHINRVSVLNRKSGLQTEFESDRWMVLPMSQQTEVFATKRFRLQDPLDMACTTVKIEVRARNPVEMQTRLSDLRAQIMQRDIHSRVSRIDFTDGGTGASVTVQLSGPATKEWQLRHLLTCCLLRGKYHRDFQEKRHAAMVLQGFVATRLAVEFHQYNAATFFLQRKIRTTICHNALLEASAATQRLQAAARQRCMQGLGAYALELLAAWAHEHAESLQVTRKQQQQQQNQNQMMTSIPPRTGTGRTDRMGTAGSTNNNNNNNFGMRSMRVEDDPANQVAMEAAATGRPMSGRSTAAGAGMTQPVVAGVRHKYLRGGLATTSSSLRPSS